MLFKTVAIVLSALFILTVQLATANAGCGGGHGYGAKSLYKKQAAKQSRARRTAQKRAAARKRKAREARLAKARKAKEIETAAVRKANETPVETAADTVEAAEPQTVAAVAETCTRFVATTGTTVSVPCSTE